MSAPQSQLPPRGSAVGGQVDRIARVLLVGVVVIGMLNWWRPAYTTWGGMMTGLTCVLVLWVVSRLAGDERRVPGSLFCAALVAPAAIAIFQFASHGLGMGGVFELRGLSGGIDVSLIFQLALIALGAMLCQSLLAGGARGLSLAAIGAAMMLCPLAAQYQGFDAKQAGMISLRLVGLCGILVWLSALPLGRVPARKAVRWALIALQAFPAALAAWAVWRDWPTAQLPPWQVMLAFGLVLTAAVACAVLARRGWFGVAIAAALLLAAGAGLASACWRVLPPGAVVPQALQGEVFGKGERALPYLPLGPNGLAALVGMIGWAGVGALTAGLAGAAAMACAKSTEHWLRRSAIVAACVAGTVALLGPDGLFTPCVSLAFAVAWGVLPAVTAAPVKLRSGIILPVCFTLLLAIVGIAKSDGLLLWAAGGVGAGDSWLHAAMSFLLALLLAWYFGSRRMWVGVTMVLVSAAVGGAGELIQLVASPREAQWEDFFWDVVGSTAAFVPYLLCMGAKARAPQKPKYEQFPNPF